MDRNLLFRLVAGFLTMVALRKESVDRNNRRLGAVNNAKIVALRKESVDRNCLLASVFTDCAAVALRKESVDRNPLTWMLTTHKILSLSARRAWIEIVISAMTSQISVSRSPQGERG